MTVGKAAALTAAFVGAFALGVAVGPSMREMAGDRDMRSATNPAETVTTTAAAPTATAAPAKPRPRQTAAGRTTSAPKSNEMASAPTRSMIPASEPRLHDRLKPVLNRGAKMDVAAEGFRSGEEFATVAHAARNTKVPFLVLKHQVLKEGRSLADAIHQVKPDVDAKAEAARAQAAAKSDVAAVAG
jgi:hypothetical protein